MMFTPIDVKLLQYDAEWVGIDRIHKVGKGKNLDIYKDILVGKGAPN